MNYRIDWRRLLDAGWWQWAVTIPLLGAHVCLGPERGRPAFEVAALLCAATAAYAYSRTGDAAAPAVQVRLVFLALLVLGLAPAARWLHWLQLAGTVATVTVGYCPLARLLALVPTDERPAPTAALVRATLLGRPISGGIFRPSATVDAATGPACASCSGAGPCGFTG